jgi:hypothetical protein
MKLVASDVLICKNKTSSLNSGLAKKSFPIRMDESTYQVLEKWAADEFRSTNGQLEWIIHEALRKAGRMKKIQTDKKPE